MCRILKGLTVTVQTHPADTRIIGLGGKYGDFLVSLTDEEIRHPVAFLLIVHREGRVIVMMHSVRRTAYGGEDEGDTQLMQLLLGVGKISAQEYNSRQAFFLHQLQGHIHFILIEFHVPDYHGIFFLLYFIFHYLYGIRKKRIGNSLNQHRHALSVCTLQISGAVVGNVAVLLNGVHNHFLRFRIDVRMVIDGSGYRADSYLADSGNILDCDLFHIFSPAQAGIFYGFRQETLIYFATVQVVPNCHFILKDKCGVSQPYPFVAALIL